MEMLSGGNPEVRPEFVFASLLSHLHKSPPCPQWTSQLKSIALLDRLIQDALFTKEISELSPSLFARPHGEPFLGIRTQKLAFSYWALVRYQASIVVENSHVLSFKRSQRKDFLKGINSVRLLEQLETLEALFSASLDVSRELRGRDRESFREQLYSVQLVQWLALLLAHKLVTFYACTMLCFQQATNDLMEQQETALRRLEVHCTRFQSNSFELVRFLKAFRRASGFSEFNYEEFNPFHSANLPLMIRAVLKELEERASAHLQGRLSSRISTPLLVEVRSFSEINIKPRTLHPRIKCPSEKRDSGSPFSEWTTAFSDSFPQQEMMTLDLILAIRKEAERRQQADVTYNLNSEAYFDDFSNFVESTTFIDLSLEGGSSPLIYKPQRTSIMSPNFQNIYSLLPAKWNEP